MASSRHHCTVQYHTVMHCAISYSDALCNTIQWCTVQYHTVMHCAISCSDALCNTIHWCTVQYHTVMHWWSRKMKIWNNRRDFVIHVYGYLTILVFSQDFSRSYTRRKLVSAGQGSKWLTWYVILTNGGHFCFFVQQWLIYGRTSHEILAPTFERY